MARGTGLQIERYGRDPGSNWHTYFPDPTGHTNELEYGIEQVGLGRAEQAEGDVVLAQRPPAAAHKQ